MAERVTIEGGVLYRADGSAASVRRRADRFAMAAAFQLWKAGTLADGAYELVLEGEGAPRLDPVPQPSGN